MCKQTLLCVAAPCCHKLLSTDCFWFSKEKYNIDIKSKVSFLLPKTSKAAVLGRYVLKRGSWEVICNKEMKAHVRFVESRFQTHQWRRTK